MHQNKLNIPLQQFSKDWLGTAGFGDKTQQYGRDLNTGSNNLVAKSDPHADGCQWQSTWSLFAVGSAGMLKMFSFFIHLISLNLRIHH